MKKFVKFTLIGLSFLLIILFLVAWFNSPGTIPPIVDAHGNTIPKSIAEHDKIIIEGTAQHLTIRGKDSTKQVILFLHGGPGNTINAGLSNSKLSLEDHFVVVQWDQFGAGRSYSKSITAEDLKMDKLITYGVEVSQYLRQRFKKEKIHLIGHSWGTHLGIFLVNQHPHLFHSYTGIAQSSYKYEGERISFEWVKAQAALRNDQKGVEALSKLTFPDSTLSMKEWNDSFGWIHRSYVNKYGGIEYGKETDIIGPLLMALHKTPEYTLTQKYNYIKGLQFSLDALWHERFDRPVLSEVDSVQVPVVVVHGVHDYNIPHDQAKSFLTQLKAPYKKFYSFEKSAHSPHGEEPEKFNAVILKELLHAN